MKESSSKKLLTSSFPLRSSRYATPQQIEVRVALLGEILERAKIKKQIIDENYLLLQMRLAGYQNYTRNILYKDRLELDSNNNYLRNFLPRYSKMQEDIANSLDEMENQCIDLYNQDWTIEKHIVRETKDGDMQTDIIEDNNLKAKLECIKARSKVIELKQKHGDGQNIQISAVIIQKELRNKRLEIVKLQEENKILLVTPKKEKK